MDAPDLYELDLAALTDERVRQQITDAATRRTRRCTTRHQLEAARTASLTTRHTNRLQRQSSTQASSEYRQEPSFPASHDRPSTPPATTAQP
ncbi:hypothetical protein ACWEO1_06260 [Kitasatospora cineracea]